MIKMTVARMNATSWLARGRFWPVEAADLTGRASVIDGDTIEIHGQRVRLFGIDPGLNRRPGPETIGLNAGPGRGGTRAPRRLRS
jgi:endonuclease YncB( thermonuclease family)